MPSPPLRIISVPPTLILHTANPLPPAPPKMSPPPSGRSLGRDNTMTVVEVSNGNVDGCLVFDASGLGRSYRFFTGGEPETKVDFWMLKVFQRERFEAGDPCFAEEPFADLLKQGADAPYGEHTFALFEYDPLVKDERGLAVVNPDGTRTVNAYVCLALQATLVLAANGAVIDACSAWSEEEKPTQQMRDLAGEFWSRRAEAGDACFTDTFDRLLSEDNNIGGAR